MLMHHIWFRPPGHTYITMHGSIDTDPMMETKQPIKLSFGGGALTSPIVKYILRISLPDQSTKNIDNTTSGRNYVLMWNPQ